MAKKISCDNNYALTNFMKEYPAMVPKFEILILRSSESYETNICEFVALTDLIVNKGKWTEITNDILLNTNLIKLVVNNCFITKINKNIDMLEKLEILVLNNNNIGIIPHCVYKMSNLCSLSLDENNIQMLSLKISNLTNLTYLSLKNNKLTYLPKSLWIHPTLKYLDISCNKISNISLPRDFVATSPLIVLKMSSNKLTNLPQCFSKLTTIEQLELDCNEFTNTGLKIIQKLTNLHNLSLTCNLITNFTQLTMNHTKLSLLSLSGNPLQSFDETIFDLPNIKNIYLKSISSLHNIEEKYLIKNKKLLTNRGIELKIINVLDVELSNNIDAIEYDIHNQENVIKLWYTSNKVKTQKLSRSKYNKK